MGVRILHDTIMGRAVLYCSTTEKPFGHGFVGDDAGDQAEAFLLWLDGEDPRWLGWQQLELRRSAFMREMNAAPDKAKWLDRLLFEDDDDTEHEAADITAELAR